MMDRKFLLSVILMLGLISGFAQHNRKISLSLETDPISTAFGAKTLSLVLEPNNSRHFSLFFNIVRADFPRWIDDTLNPNNRNKNFESKINIGGGFAIDYFIDPDHDGIYFGLINLFFENQISSNSTTSSIHTHNLIPRIGYRKFLFGGDKFYVNPFFGLRYEYSLSNNVAVGDQVFKPAGLQPFGTIHLGYHF